MTKNNKNPPVAPETPAVETPETGPYLTMTQTPRGHMVRAVWLKGDQVSRRKDLYGPAFRVEAEDQFRIAVVEMLFNVG